MNHAARHPAYNANYEATKNVSASSAAQRWPGLARSGTDIARFLEKASAGVPAGADTGAHGNSKAIRRKAKGR